jgi:hypothetical protein
MHECFSTGRHYCIFIQLVLIAWTRNMNSHSSAEAAALVRYVRATRAVTAAFDATRSEPELGADGRAVALALQRLDSALLELETSQRSLDAILSRAGGH